MMWNSVRITTQLLVLIAVTALAVLASCYSSPAYQASNSAKPVSATEPASPSSQAAQSYTVNVTYKAGIGNYLVGYKGMSLYFFNKDTSAHSNATAGIVLLWPVFYSQEMLLPLSLDPADFAVITRADGLKQVTFRGWPLYYYSKDRSAGDTLGQGIAGVWFVVDPYSLQPAPLVPSTAPAPTGEPYYQLQPNQGGGGGY
jgi:predicted lipoprotein with Yx(FWY)xxD motif